MPTNGQDVKIAHYTRSKFNSLTNKDSATIYYVEETDGKIKQYIGNTHVVSDIAKSQVEAVLTGTITTHTHNASALVQNASNRLVTDTEKTTWNGKVDKVTGKGLSTNDYTTTEKNKLSGIAAGAQVNVATNLSQGARNTTTLRIDSSTGTNITLPAVTTSLAGLMTSTDKTRLNVLHSLLEEDTENNVVDSINEVLAVFNNYPEGADLVTALAGKVDKVTGKGLSTNDYTTTEKNKLSGIAAGAQVNVATNLSRLQATTEVTILSSTGSSATITSATTDLAGVMSTADKTKLNGIAAGAHVNRTIATTAQAQTGTNNTTAMTPLRVKEAITANAAPTSHTHGVVTTSTNGFMSAVDKAKLNGIESGAQVNVATNLSSIHFDSRVSILPSTGSSTSIDSATAFAAGVMSADDKAKLDGIATGATANKGTVTYVGAGTQIKGMSMTITNGTTTPTITTSISNAANFRAAIGAGTSYFSGSYNDLSNKPTIPSIPSVMNTTEGNTGTATTQRTINAANLKSIILNHSPAGSRPASDVSAWAKKSSLAIGDIPTGTNGSTVAIGNHTHGVASTSYAGFMSADDKTKLDGITTGGGGEYELTKLKIDTALVGYGTTSLQLGRNASSQGTYSTAIGQNATASGNTSVAIGQGATAAGGNSTALGRNASAEAAQTTALGHGATASALSVNGTAVGYNASAASYGTALGQGATASGSYSTALGRNAIAEGSYSTAIGRSASTGTTQNRIQLGNTSVASLQSKVQLTVTSDIRDKADIEEVPKALDFIKDLSPITYVSNDRDYYISEEQKETDTYRNYLMVEDYDKGSHSQGTKKGSRRRVGLSAQEVREKLIEHYGSDNYANVVNDNFVEFEERELDIPEGLENQLTMSYETLVPFLIKAIQEQQEQIEELKNKINSDLS